MTFARREIVNDKEVSSYHCISRCVRRAFLCGADKLTGKSFDHRREWIRSRLSFLTKHFAIEVIAYAVMSNHLHSLLRIRPDQAKSWSAEEVAARWRTIFPLDRKGRKAAKPTKEEIEAIAGNPRLVELYRTRLSSISWFNRCMNENIARRANAEDECTGRFWEGRFKCQRVFDVAGLLACSAYIDLNPIRAGVALTLETSDHTSIQDRIHKKQGSIPSRCGNWAKVPLVEVTEFTDKRLSIDDYLRLVDETGRTVKDKEHSLSADVAPILSKLMIDPKQWCEVTRDLHKQFKRIVGPEERIRAAAGRVKRAWFQGLCTARKLFKSAA